MTRSTKKLAVHAVVMLALVGGTTVLVAFDKKVTLIVDGEERTLHTFAGTVADLLKGEGITVSSRDAVAPDLHALLSDRTTVAVRYARRVRLDLNGRPRDTWVTATNVEEALHQLAVDRADKAFVSASRSMPIGREGLDPAVPLVVRTARSVAVLVDGERRDLTTTELTVSQLLRTARILIGRYDRVSVPVTAFPTENMVVSIQRIDGRTVRDEVEIPFSVKRVFDSAHRIGWTKITVTGVPGRREITYEELRMEGKPPTRRQLANTVRKQPTTEVVVVGTEPAERPDDTSDGSGGNGSGADGLNWAALARCESGGNPHAVNSVGPYYGLYQFQTGTWHSVGGSGVPSQASASEQTHRAKILYKRSGRGQWPVCGKNL